MLAHDCHSKAHTSRQIIRLQTQLMPAGTINRLNAAESGQRYFCLQTCIIINDADKPRQRYPYI